MNDTIDIIYLFNMFIKCRYTIYLMLIFKQVKIVQRKFLML